MATRTRARDTQPFESHSDEDQRRATEEEIAWSQRPGADAPLDKLDLSKREVGRLLEAALTPSTLASQSDEEGLAVVEKLKAALAD